MIGVAPFMEHYSWLHPTFRRVIIHPGQPRDKYPNNVEIIPLFNPSFQSEAVALLILRQDKIYFKEIRVAKWPLVKNDLNNSKAGLCPPIANIRHGPLKGKL